MTLAIQKYLANEVKVQRNYPHYRLLYLARLIAGFLLITGSSLAAFYQHFTWNSDWGLLNTLAIALMIIHLVLFSYYVLPSTKRNPSKRKLVFWSQGSSLVLIQFTASSIIAPVIGIPWVIQATELYPLKPAGWITAALFALCSASLLLSSPENQFLSTLAYCLAYAAFFTYAVVATYRANEQQKLKEEKAETYRILLATEELASEHSKQAERLRIARDLHDQLGHLLTAQILQLEIASRIASDQGKLYIQRALSLSRLLLGDLRSTVNELRAEDNEIDFQQAVENLLIDQPNIKITFDIAPYRTRNIFLLEILLKCVRKFLADIVNNHTDKACHISLINETDVMTLTLSLNAEARVGEEQLSNFKSSQETITRFGGSIDLLRGQQAGVKIQIPKYSPDANTN